MGCYGFLMAFVCVVWFAYVVLGLSNVFVRFRIVYYVSYSCPMCSYGCHMFVYDVPMCSYVCVLCGLLYRVSHVRFVVRLAQIY